MLDVMRKPPEVAVPVTWIATRVRVPDTDRTVLVYMPEDEDDPVWMGWWDANEECFRAVDSGASLGSFVTWWAERPAAPVEPKAAGCAKCGTPSECAKRGCADAVFERLNLAQRRCDGCSFATEFCVGRCEKEART